MYSHMNYKARIYPGDRVYVDRDGYYHKLPFCDLLHESWMEHGDFNLTIYGKLYEEKLCEECKKVCLELDILQDEQEEDKSWDPDAFEYDMLYDWFIDWAKEKRRGQKR